MDTRPTKPSFGLPGSCPDIVLLGHIVKERIFFSDHTLGPVLGSPVAYGSVVAGRLGEKVGIVTIIGTDMPEELLKPFSDGNVDITGMVVKPGRWTTTTELVYREDGTKEIRYPQKASPIQFEDIPHVYHQAKVFYIATMDHDVPLETIYLMRELGGLMAIDLGGYGGAHSREHPTRAEQDNPEALRNLVRCVDVVRASVEDCAHLLGAEQVTTEADEEAVIRRLLEWGADVALLTLGERGCIVGQGTDVHRVPAVQGEVIDTTGAGDSFSTAFLVAYMHTQDIVWSAQFGAAVAINIIERSGGVCAERMPTREEVGARLAVGRG